MPKFWITRTETRRTLVEAPSRNAALTYSNSDAFGDYLDTVSPDTADTIEEVSTKTGVDVTLDVRGEPIDDEAK